MEQDIIALPGRWRLAGLALLYAALMLYSSTIIGPAGMNFVYQAPAKAFRIFLATPYVEHGSDQRADWIGNLLMLVPFGFIVTGALSPRRAVPGILAAIPALAICVAVILAIKYLQLFFPPRTVTLNYIMAQTAGALIGCGGWTLWQAQVSRLTARGDLVAAFVLALWLYCGALVIFILMPLDFALQPHDVRAQLLKAPSTLWVLPGDGRPPPIRAILVVAAGAAFIPMGMLLTFTHQGIYRVRRGLPSVAVIGVLITTVLYAVSLMVISAFPVAPSILYRSLGIVVGAGALRWLVRLEPKMLRGRLRRSIPILVLPYLVGVMVLNQLISAHWLSWHGAVAQAYKLGLLPLFDYYIVTKAEAAKNIVGHTALYMPVGIMMWLRYGEGVAGRAGVMAATLAFCVEFARYFRPGHEGDINTIFLAGFAAVLGARLAPAIWTMFTALARNSRPVPVRLWDQRNGVPTAAQELGDVEQF